MTASQQRELQKAIEAKRRELRHEIQVRLGRLVIDPASDPVDQMCGVAERDLAAMNIDRMHDVLRLVERAMLAMRDGTYGQCAGCGDAIPLKRLDAAPWTPYCVCCQERAESLQAAALAPGTEPPHAIGG